MGVGGLVVVVVIRSFVGSPGTEELVENTKHHILSLKDKEMICRRVVEGDRERLEKIVV